MTDKHPPRTLAQRLHAAMQEVDYVQKEKRPGMRYSIVSHDAVTAKVRPVLVRHGVIYPVSVLSHTRDGNMTVAEVRVTFMNVDNPADRISVRAFGYGIDDQDKGPGKAISYAVKYALLKTLGLETGDDPDDDQDAEHRPSAPLAATDGPLMETVLACFRGRGFAADKARDLAAAAKRKRRVSVLDAELAQEIVRSVEAGAWDKFLPGTRTVGIQTINEKDLDETIRSLAA